MKQAASWKSDPLRDAEARIRALTHEVGSLREDLRRETKRRERAVARTRECEQLQDDAKGKVQQLEFAQLKLNQQLEAAQTTARVSNERNKKTLGTLRNGLSQVETAVAQRFKDGQQHLQGAYAVLQKLQKLLFTPHPLLSGSSPLAPVAAHDARQALQQLTLALNKMGGLFSSSGLEAADPSAAAASRCSSSSSSGTSSSSSSSSQKGHDAPGRGNGTAEGGGDCAAAAEQSQEVQQRASEWRQEAQVLKGSVGELGAALAEAERHREELQQRCAALQQGQADIDTLRQEAGRLSASLVHAERQRQELQQQNEALRRECTEVTCGYNEVVAAAQRHLQQADGDAAARAELEAARAQLQQQVGSLQEECQAAEASASRLQATVGSLQAALDDRERQIEQQRSKISSLQSQISSLQTQILDQQADIKSALTLVSARKHTPPARPALPYSPRPRPASADMAYTHLPPSAMPFQSAAFRQSNHTTAPPPLPSVPTTTFPSRLPACTPHSSAAPTDQHIQLHSQQHPFHTVPMSNTYPPAHNPHPPTYNPYEASVPHYNPPATSTQQQFSHPLIHDGRPQTLCSAPHPRHPASSSSLPPYAVAQAFHHLSNSTVSNPPPQPQCNGNNARHYETPQIQPHATHPPLPPNNLVTLTTFVSSPSATSTSLPQPPSVALPHYSSHASPPTTANSQQQRPQPVAGLQHIGQLKRDMLDLDSDIAELEANLKAATLRLS